MQRALVVSVLGYLFLAVAPANSLPRCEAGALIVSTGDGYTCKQVQEVLERARGSSSNFQFILPDCSSGQTLESEGFGRWRCVERPALPSCSSGEMLRSEGSSGWRCMERPVVLPQCSSGEVLRSEGSSGWRCMERPVVLPQCSSGEVLVGAGGRDFRCERQK